MPSKKLMKSLQKLTNRELKQRCRDAGMKVSGSKPELINRLCGGKEEKTKMSTRAVNNWLQKQGVVNVKRVSRCLRAGIHMGYIDISGDDPLNNVVISDACYLCDYELDVTIRDLLYQPDYAGHDYESGGMRATVKCPNKECELKGVYVSGICCDSMYIDSGKGHNHCSICPGFGKCMGDYREEHCRSCGDHYDSCRGLFRCHCKGSGSTLDDKLFSFV
ncbi:uncharacterized protein LOC117106857 [Anneissia japonica]|uniref:uncharacterized protein LOC117106857 n=1 Tax=Anneissia japonica TaxID=1529436 RepID=UPI00142559F7|nr:uncharacterized protein LOC117106857 [Anneissia japonica]